MAFSGTSVDHEVFGVDALAIRFHRGKRSRGGGALSKHRGLTARDMPDWRLRRTLMHGWSPPLTLYTGRLEDPLRWAERHCNLGVLRRARGVPVERELLAGRFEAALAMLVSGQHA